MPAWSVPQALQLAAEVEACLRGPDRDTLLAGLRQPTPPQWQDDVVGLDRLRSLVTVFVRLRACTASGRWLEDFTGPPSEIPPGYRPWFAHRHARGTKSRVVFGHWAALGVARGAGWLALDSGCVWGRKLSACRLDDGEILQVDAVEKGPRKIDLIAG